MIQWHRPGAALEEATAPMMPFCPGQVIELHFWRPIEVDGRYRLW